jgi:hypothetical protein
MKIQDLLKKIEALENRVKELEARPMQSVPVYMPNHFIQKPPPIFPFFWNEATDIWRGW